MAQKTISESIELNDKVALVTGGSAGIGEAIVRRLHEAGACVVVADVDAVKGSQLVEELVSVRPNSALFCTVDVSDDTQVQAMVNDAAELSGAIDILVNNAGIYPMKTLQDMAEKDFMRVIDVNLRGLFLCTKTVSEHMKHRGEGGKIINITSVDALHPSMLGLAHYDASKHGAWGFTKSTALEQIGRAHV